MVDIAKCSRSDCGKRLNCFRYLADADDYGQTYIIIDDMDLTCGCKNFWLVRNGKELKYYNKANTISKEV